MRLGRFVLPMLAGLLLLSACSQHRKEVQGFIEGQFTYLASDFSGNLENLLVYRGHQVQAGQKLFVLDQMPQIAQLKQAQFDLSQAEQNLENLIKGQRINVLKGIEAQIEQAQANFTFAAQTLHRDKYLYKTGAIGEAQLDNAQANYRATQQQVYQYKADLAEAKLGARVNAIFAQQAAVKAAQQKVQQLIWELSQKTVYSPFNARVFDTFYRKGEYVPAGRPVLAILAPKDIKLVFYLPQRLLSQTQVGEKVFFTCDGCKGKTTATINYIAPQAEYTPPILYSRTARDSLVFRVEAHITPKQAIKFNPGQPVDVTLKTKK